jgi:hypothetical protein
MSRRLSCHDRNTTLKAREVGLGERTAEGK